MEQIDPAIKDIQIVPERDLPSPLIPVPGARRVVRNIHPGGGSISGLQLQSGVVGLHPERVSSTVAAEAVFDGR